MSLKFKMNKPTLWLLGYLFVWLMPGGLEIPVSVQVVLRLALLCWILLRKIRLNTVLKLYLLLGASALVSVLVSDPGLENFLKTLSMLTVPVGMLIFFNRTRNRTALIRQLFGALSAFLAVDVFSAFFLPNGLTQNVLGAPVYFSGGKFTAAYLYVAWMTLFCLRYREARWPQLLCITAFGILYALRVDCTTGLLAIVAFGIVGLLPKFMTTKKRQYMWLGGMLVVNYAIVVLQVQNTSPALSAFITQVLHRSIHLTGRLRIYQSVPSIMEGHWLLGYGYTNAHIMEVTGLANMQNAFLQTIYTGGLVGLLFDMMLLVKLFAIIANLEDERSKVTFLQAITAFLVIAIVEIPFTNSLFFLVVALITLHSKERATTLRLSKPANARR